MRKRRAKGSQKPKALSGGEKKKQSPRLGLNGAIDPVPEEDTPNRGLAQASRQVYARYLSHFFDLKAFNQLCQGACQSCQTMSGCSVDTKRWWQWWWWWWWGLCIMLRGGTCMCSSLHPACPSPHNSYSPAVMQQIWSRDSAIGAAWISAWPNGAVESPSDGPLC